jgi:hypothetical protein
MIPSFRGHNVWTPAFAGVTVQETFYETILLEVRRKVAFRSRFS